MSLKLNARALAVAELMAAQAGELRVGCHLLPKGGRILDCGIAAEGGLNAGLLLARVCLADLAQVALVPGPQVQVFTDAPLAACLGAQYAGWEIKCGQFFAMGSGPMRASAGREEWLRHLGLVERASALVGVLETRQLPGPEVLDLVAETCGVLPEQVTLLCAPTASLAGTLQIVARAIETALHKLHLLGFDLSQIRSAYGLAPLPPVPSSDLTALGLTNDAIRFGGQVVLWTRDAQNQIDALGPRVPASATPDGDIPFLTLFERQGRNFYALDPMLFSPAVITFHDQTSGRSSTWGRLAAVT
jgi:methenyltetrahydromethanopterin cyclohydrolase